ncbi:MAG: hypothetical protein WAO35_28645 [Terriglobia bacterium]
MDNPDMAGLQAPKASTVAVAEGEAPLEKGSGWRGWAIPLGLYWIKKPEGTGLAQLVKLQAFDRKPYPFESPKYVHRAGLEIRFRGPKGSDSCIVPRQRDDFFKLMNLLSKAREPKKGYAGILQVLAQ